MRAINRWIGPLALIMATAACDDLLTENPSSFLTPENFYQTVGDAEAALVAAYAPLGSTQAFGYNLWVTLDGGSDEAMSNPVVPSSLVQSFGRLDYDPTQDRITTSWVAFYQVITRANILIDRLPELDAPEDQKAELTAEAKFLRAFSYFYLVRLYGGVPLVTGEQDPLERNVPRASTDQVYELIIADAEDAAAELPLERGAGDLGRATRGAALALLSDVYLTRGEWESAADHARQVMDLGVYDLYADYLDAFLPAYKNGPEHIFSIQFVDAEGSPGSQHAYFYFPREVGNGQGGGWAWIVPNPTHTDSYAPGDYRKDVTYVDEFVRLATGEAEKVDKLHTYKFRPTQVARTTSGDANSPVYRYAEVLLTYAEALNELGQTDEAIRQLDVVRARARNADGTPRSEPADYAGPASREAVREAIFDERRWELAHEGKRWFDMVRRGEDYWMTQLQENAPQAEPAPHKMLLPIPQTEINQNTALEQNPGY